VSVGGRKSGVMQLVNQVMSRVRAVNVLGRLASSVEYQ
jgi:hypothetical protein